MRRKRTTSPCTAVVSIRNSICNTPGRAPRTQCVLSKEPPLFLNEMINVKRVTEQMEGTEQVLAHSLPHSVFHCNPSVFLPHTVTKEIFKNINQGISHACITFQYLEKNKVLNPANETLQEGRWPASLPQLGHLPIAPFQPSGAERAPHHLRLFQALASAGLLFPTLHLATLTSFSQSPCLSLQDEPGSSVFLTCILFMSRFTFVSSMGLFNVCLSH